MSDLISRSQLLKEVEKYKFGAISNDAEREYIKKTILDFINFQPTAYDIDKVVEELETNKQNALEVEESIKEYNVWNKAIEIVKQGGVSDDVCEKDKGGGMMERLTIDEIIEHCERKTKLYEEIGKSIDFETIELTDAIKEYWEHRQVKEYLEELKRYRDADEQGLLFRLPCKVGDTIYRVNTGAKEPVIKMRVLQVIYKQLHKDRIIIRIDAINDNDMGESCYFLENLGKTVFLTKEEAEQKLKEMESD